jgi:hypothetical protein
MPMAGGAPGKRRVNPGSHRSPSTSAPAPRAFRWRAPPGCAGARATKGPLRHHRSRTGDPLPPDPTSCTREAAGMGGWK